jgi:2',3'-cyclic-nucleotide 2'-phosphodiesterase (5'-nucleotidase family)
LGGLSKKAFLIKNIANKENLPYLFVDSGALLFKKTTFHSNPHAQKADSITARGIAAVMELMDCKAAGIAPQDLAGGIDRLKKFQKEQNLNWVSANLVDQESKKPVFSTLIKTQAGSTKVAILGLTDDGYQPGDKNSYTLLSWKDVLPEYLARAKEEADMVILLSSYPEPINRDIAQTFDGIDVILQSGHASANQAPLKIKNTLLARVSARGKYLGMMRVHWTETGKWGQDLAKKIRKEQNKLDRISWQIGRMEKKKPVNELKTIPRYTALVADKEKSQQQIQMLQKEKDAGANDPCSFTNQFIGLKTSTPEDKEVQAILDQTTREVNSLNKNRKRSASVSHQTSLDKLAGSQQCQECHPSQVAFWKATNHAKAWQTLENDNQQFNDDCLICHVTLPYYDLARVKKEQLLVQLPEKFRDVGCESCHGLAATHIKTPESSQPVLPQKETCLQCHTDEHDDNFIYAEKLKKIRCPKG